MSGNIPYNQPYNNYNNNNVSLRTSGSSTPTWSTGGMALPDRHPDNTMMQSMDSLRSTMGMATTTAAGGNSDTMRSEDLNRLFQLGDKEWDTVMEE